MLKITNVSKSYLNSETKAVDNISLEIKSGEIFGFIGPNGAGKSTTIKMITGILSIDDGDIFIDGKSIRRDTVEAKKVIGYVSDNHEVYERLTGLEYLSFIGNVYGVPIEKCRRLTNEFCEVFALSQAIGSQISTYSHGMKQKLMVISALIHEPKLWVLDEPLTGLDPQSAYELKRIMRSHADKGNTVFFSSHILEVVEKLCDRVSIINRGRIVSTARPDDLKRNGDKSLENIFLDITSNQKSNV